MIFLPLAAALSLLIVVGCWSVRGVTAATPVSAADYPVCQQVGQCSATSLRTAFYAFPTHIFPTVTTLDFTGQPIATLQGTELQPFKGLRFVYFTQLWLTSVPEGLFGNNTSLETILLNQLVITRWSTKGVPTLPVRLFENNTQLVWLDMSGSGLLWLPAGLFVPTPHLSQLTLSSNALVTLPDSLLDPIRAPSVFVDLSDNPLGTLGEGTFLGLAGRPTTATANINLQSSTISLLPYRIPLGVVLTGLSSTPASSMYKCLAYRRGVFELAPKPGTVSSFCTYQCTQCGPDQHVASACNNITDNTCAALPAACVTQGACRALNLTDIPPMLQASITTLDLRDNKIFAVNRQRLAQLTALNLSSNDSILFSGNPGYRNCLPSHTAEAQYGLCTHACSVDDGTVCSGTTQYIRWNCTSTLPAVCDTCSVTPCQLAQGYTTANCSLYSNKLCTPCTLCNRSDNMYTRSPCTEFQDATCAGCSPCGPAQYEVQDCGGSADRVCGACDPACASCHGNDSYSCAACSAGYQFVDMGAYGGQTGVQRCVPREACTYSAWSPWSNCSTMCGGGTADRTRNLTSQWPCYDSQAADGTQPCNTQQCEEPTLTFHLLITNMTAAGINSTQRHAITALFVITLSLEPFVVSLLSVEDAPANQTVLGSQTADVQFLVSFPNTTALAVVASYSQSELSSSAFVGNISIILGSRVTLRLTAPPSPSPSPSAVHVILPRQPTPSLFSFKFIVILAGAAALLIGGHAATYCLWYQATWTAKSRRAVSTRWNLEEKRRKALKERREEEGRLRALCSGGSKSGQPPVESSLQTATISSPASEPTSRRGKNAKISPQAALPRPEVHYSTEPEVETLAEGSASSSQIIQTLPVAPPATRFVAYAKRNGSVASLGGDSVGAVINPVGVGEGASSDTVLLVRDSPSLDSPGPKRSGAVALSPLVPRVPTAAPADSWAPQPVTLQPLSAPLSPFSVDIPGPSSLNGPQRNDMTWSVMEDRGHREERRQARRERRAARLLALSPQARAEKEARHAARRAEKALMDASERAGRKAARKAARLAKRLQRTAAGYGSAAASTEELSTTDGELIE